MYLTSNQTNWLANFFETNKEKKFTAKELAVALNNSKVECPYYDIVSIAAFSCELGLEYRKKQLHYTREKIKNCYYYYYDNIRFQRITITDYKKIKNLLFFKNKENINFYYNFETHNFNISLDSIYYIGRDLEIKESKKAHQIFEYIAYYATSYVKEWIFSYPQLWNSALYSTFDINFDCEKGYINFLKEKNLTISYQSYYCFKIKDYLTHANIYTIKNWALLVDRINMQKRKYLFSYPVLFSLITKMVMIEIKNFNIYTNIPSAIFELVQILYLLEAEKDNFSILDTNRDLSYNLLRLKQLKNNQKNNILARILQVINAINHLQISDYEVIVPQNLIDLQNESKQQNNCVGYYYNDSIMQSENYIYFLRKKINPDESYMTCRFNVNSKATIERYYKNNEYVDNKKELEILKQIDEKIRQILSI